MLRAPLPAGPPARPLATLVVLVWVLANGPSSVPADEAPAPQALGLRLLDVTGQAHQLGDREGTRAVALVFLSPECPISNQYLPELNRLAAAWAELPLEFYGVLSDPGLSRARAQTFAEEYRPAFPLLWDSAGALAEALGPSHVPQAFVLDGDGQIVYRGRIDDQFAAVGRRRARVSRHDLAAAVEAVLAGNRPEVSETEPVGCPREKRPRGEPTFARHVAPILRAQCAECHRPGSVAPFALLSYADAAKRAEFLAQVTASRQMPPWKIHPGTGHFRGERRLSRAEIATLAAWAAAGAPEGDPAETPPLVESDSGWQLGEPDLVLTMAEEYRVPADGPDVFRYFVIPIEIPADQEVVGVEFRPGNPRVVHHAILYLDTTGAARKFDAADPEPGYEGGLVPGFAAGTLGFWAPGYTPRRLPEGVGHRLARGSDLALQLHYHPSGKEELDRSQVALYFAPRPVERFVTTLALIDLAVDIPPGATEHRMRYDFTTPVEVELLDVTPHMHLIGTEMKVTATLPDGEERLLVWSDWDFNWQDQYRFREPLRLPAGTRFDLEAVYDNSSGNPANPNVPPARITLGEMTTDEMCICAFNMLEAPDEPSRQLLRSAMQRSIGQQMANPLVMVKLAEMLKRNPQLGIQPRGGSPPDERSPPAAPD